MDPYRLYCDELESLSKDFRGFRIFPKKESILCRVLNVILIALTWGKTTFMSSFHTVIGKTIYVAPSWENTSYLNRAITLRHEGVHLRQAEKMGLGCFWLGWVIWSFAYIFLLPAGWTLRGFWEKEAYTETIRCCQKYNLSIDREKMINLFTSEQYFWMWPWRKRVEAWLDQLGVN